MVSQTKPESYIYVVYAHENFIERLSDKLTVIEPTPGERLDQAGKILAGIAIGAIGGAGYQSTRAARDATVATTGAKKIIRDAALQHVGFTNQSTEAGKNCVFNRRILAEDVALFALNTGAEQKRYFRLNRASGKEQVVRNFGQTHKTGAEFCPYEPLYIVSTIPPEVAQQDGIRGGMCFLGRDAAERFARDGQQYIQDNMGQLPKHKYHPHYTVDGKLRRGVDARLRADREAATTEMRKAYADLRGVIQEISPRNLAERAFDTIKEIYLNDTSDPYDPAKYLNDYRLYRDVFGSQANFEEILNKSLTPEQVKSLETAFDTAFLAVAKLEEIRAQEIQQADDYTQTNISSLTAPQVLSALKFKRGEAEILNGKIDLLEQQIKALRAYHAFTGERPNSEVMNILKAQAKVADYKADLVAIKEQIGELRGHYQTKVKEEGVAEPDKDFKALHAEKRKEVAAKTIGDEEEVQSSFKKESE